MDKSSSSVTVLLFLMNLPFFGHALFEYICDEKQLYRPYVHIYRTRRGERILDVGPGFHDMTDLSNVYVCINGVAYLYFSKSTEFGEVYETPQLKMYAHSCEMYNVQPREGSASVMEVQLHLRAILLLGDPNDYRRPSIQKFTAPYFFKKDQLNLYKEDDPNYVPMPSIYINASSLIIIGQSECTLLKGNNRNTIIKVRPHIFPPVEDKEKKVEIGHLCKIGFQPLLEKATTKEGTAPPATDRAPAMALINDEAIRVERCQGTPTFDESEAKMMYDISAQEIEEIDKEYNQKKTEILEKFNKMVEAVVTPLTEEKTKLEAKKGDEKTKPKDVKKIEKHLNKTETRIKVEEEKKKAFEDAMTALTTEITELNTKKTEADPSGGKGSTAKTDKTAIETAEKELETIKEQKPPAPQSEIDTKQEALDAAKKKAKTSAREFLWAMSDLELGLVKLKKTVEKVKRLMAYSPSSSKGKSTPKGKKGALNINPDGSTSVVIVSEEPNCQKLPVLEGDDGDCKKGKPEAEHTCNMFKTTLGQTNPWEGKDDVIWKSEILEMIAKVFTLACDRIPNVKKLSNITNRVMGYYLNNEKIFNLQPNLTTDTCLNFKMVKNLKILGAAGAASQTDVNYKEEKQFWNTIKLALNDCINGARRMAFKEKAPGEFQVVKNAGTDKEEAFDVLRHHEQADKEYSYNWPIDMNWKMFVTVMGFCMPEYEKKIPLITSRFFSLYTEYFLIPLRETWINPKDNIIFQFVMGEFYNEHIEMWADVCMEASFVYAGQRDYRPPRSLLVNCASEHNYFVNGDFVKFPPKKAGAG